jgi:hypothetical protein
MKTIFNSIILSFIILILASCEDVVQIKLDEGSKLYVIDAFINDLREDQKIRVVTNDSYFSNREAPPVTNALVELRDLTDNKQYIFNYTTNGYYTFPLQTNDTIAKVNHSYEIKVTIDGVVYSSTAMQKRAAKIDSIMAMSPEGGFGPPPPSNTKVCLLIARDKADNNPDYYWIKTFRNDTLFSGPSDLNVSIDGTNGAVINASSDSILFTPPGSLLGFKSYKIGDKCRVEIHSISRETYFFFIQAINQINNGGLFATTPENVKTNFITPEGAKVKAIGRFNMSAVAFENKLIQ